MRELPDPRQERQALNWGLAGAFVLRVAMLVSASWTVKFWQVEVLGAIYLLWLAGICIFFSAGFGLLAALPSSSSGAIPHTAIKL